MPTGALYVILQESILAISADKVQLTEAETVKIHGYGSSLCRTQKRDYKAAPRDGVWATPPFLHNGSVPNLYEMLIPAK